MFGKNEMVIEHAERMRWLPLARKEGRTIATSKGAWLLAALLAIWGYRPDYLGWDALGPNIAVAYIQNAATILLPLGVLLLSFRSVVGERTSGSLKFVLGLPLTRTDILLGKIVGRTAGLAVPVFASFAVLAVIGLLDYGPFDPLLFLAVVAVTIAYVAVLVTVAVSVSAVVSDTVPAVGVVFGFFLILEVFWQTVVLRVYPLLVGGSGAVSGQSASGLLFFLVRLSPRGAYNVVTNWLLGVGNSAAGYSLVLTKLQPNTFIANVFVVEAAFQPGTAPWYLHEALGLLVLLGWVLVPLGVARFWFQRGDLA